VNILILGAGQQGYAVAVDLLRERELLKVTITDTNVDRLDFVWGELGDPRVVVRAADSAEPATLSNLFAEHDAVVSALPCDLNLELARLAVASKRHFVDIGGSTEVTVKELALHDEARSAGIALLPDMGLAPGMANVVAADLIEGFDECDTIRIRVGGLPVRPVGPLGYRLVFSVEGLLAEYGGEAEILRRGQRIRVAALSELEPVELPPPFGQGEAAITAGGLSTMPETFEGKLANLDFKTIRYPGHFEKVRFLAALGLLDREEKDYGRGIKLSPRVVVGEAFSRATHFPDVPDLVVFRVTAEGDSGGERIRTVVESLDFGEPARGVTAMMRMTAYPAASAVRRLARGELELAGAFPPERGIPWQDLRNDLESRNISFTQREGPVASMTRKTGRVDALEL